MCSSVHLVQSHFFRVQNCQMFISMSMNYDYDSMSMRLNGKNNWIIFELEVVCGNTFLNLINLLSVGYINLIKPLDTS